MDSGSIRPRLPELPDPEDDFEGTDDSFVPAARVSRKPPPTISSGGKLKATTISQPEPKRPSIPGQHEQGDRFELDLENPPARAPLASPSPTTAGLLGNIKENKRSESNLPFRPLQSSGFPIAQRRQPTTTKPKESRFKASMRQKYDIDKPSPAPSVTTPHRQKPEDALHAEIDAENNQKLEQMSEEEILEAQKELMAMLGGDMISFLRERNNQVPGNESALCNTDTPGFFTEADNAGATSSNGSQAGGLHRNRSVRFSDKVSYSNPPSRSPSPPPARKAIPLPAPELISSSKGAGSAIKALDEDDPESIRQKYFPEEPLSATLDWMREGDSEGQQQDDEKAEIRFDLNGQIHKSGPEFRRDESHRHAGSGDRLTLSEILALSKSAVMGQRVLAFQVLLKVFNQHATAEDEATEVLLSSDNVTAIIESCARGLTDKSVGVVAAALAVMEQYAVLERSRLNTAAAVLTVKPSPLETFSFLLSTNYELPHLSALSCLNVLHSLLNTREDFVSTEIVEATFLLENIGRTFLQVPWPPTDESSLPEPKACDLFSIIISMSRANAEALITRRIEQATLRYIAVHPWHLDDRLKERGFRLSAAAMDVFTAYARYGMACSTCSNSASLFGEIQDYITEKPFEELDFTRSWLDLLEAWCFCAIDPHSTIPEHDILWQETKDWGDHLSDILIAVGQQKEVPLLISRRLVAALSAWLQGAAKHDRPAYNELTERLNAQIKKVVEDVVKEAAEEPVTEEKAKTLLAIKSLVGSAKMDLGDTASILNRIVVEPVPEEPRTAAPEADDEGWIH